MTGISLLAYLAHCETPLSEEFGENVLKGISFLVDLGMKNPVLSEQPALKEGPAFGGAVQIEKRARAFSKEAFSTCSAEIPLISAIFSAT